MALKIEDEHLAETVEALLARFRALPDLDSRSAEEILDYDECGVFREGGDFSKTDVPLDVVKKI